MLFFTRSSTHILCIFRVRELVVSKKRRQSFTSLGWFLRIEKSAVRYISSQVSKFNRAIIHRDILQYSLLLLMPDPKVWKSFGGITTWNFPGPAEMSIIISHLVPLFCPCSSKVHFVIQMFCSRGQPNNKARSQKKSPDADDYRVTLVVFTLFPVLQLHPLRSGNTLHSSPSIHGCIWHHHFCATIEASTHDGAALVVPATCPGKQEHLTVWDLSSILFLLQHRCAAMTSQVPAFTWTTWLLCDVALVICPHRDNMQTMTSSALLHMLCRSRSRILSLWFN